MALSTGLAAITGRVRNPRDPVSGPPGLPARERREAAQKAVGFEIAHYTLTGRYFPELGPTNQRSPVNSNLRGGSYPDASAA